MQVEKTHIYFLKKFRVEGVYLFIKNKKNNFQINFLF